MSGILQTLFLGAAAAVKDGYFNLVTLLLNTTATNGAQNNTFLDSSTNNFSITRNGNTTQGTFTPFSQTGWSNSVTATGSYLTVTSQPLINVNDWTVEFWMYPTQYNNNGGIFGASNGGGTQPKLYLYVTGANLIIEGYSGGFFTALSTAQPTLNQWTYVSVSRSSSTGNAYIYYNGVLQGSAAAVPAITGITGGFSLLSNGESSSAGFYGYMSNMRVSNVARYTGSSYSVPTAPSTAIANTTLLTAQSNRYVDNSTNGYAIVVTGTPSVQAFSPFAPTTAYDTAVVGGSGYFDGTGDNLTWTGTAAGSGAFSYEFWLYSLVDFSVNRAPLGVLAISGYNSALDVRMSGTTINMSAYNIANNNFTVPTLVPNTWYHVVLCRNASNQATVFLNGVRSSTGAVTIAQNFAGLTSVIGAQDAVSSSERTTGYLSDVRLIVGSTPYDPTASTITVPTAPLTAITNTQLLTKFINAGIFDSAAKNVLETVGNAQVSTTQAKWGTTSMYFDGTGDYLQLANPSPNVQLGSGNFTIEMWAYFSVVSATRVLNNYGYESGGTKSFIIYYDSSTLHFGYSPNGSSSTDVSLGAFVPAANTWYHIAIVRNGTTVTGYVDGTALSSPLTIGTNSINYPSNSGAFRIGTDATNYFNGYIGDYRFTKGYARYTSNFTPPTAAFPV